MGSKTTGGLLRVEIVGSGEPLVTTTGSAALLNISSRTFRALVADRKIRPAASIGNTQLFAEREVLALRAKLSQTT